MNYKDYLVISKEVQEALDSNKAVVALESTIISHGFNYPENLECARECERIIREQGAVPATIGIRDGKIIVGLSSEDIVFFAENRTIRKCSRRDVAPVLAMGLDGATTVATTMMFAEMAGIKIFATGGVGGVHVHGEDTMDVSADLEELSQTNVNVICAGVKSILDIPRTKEYLETNGVTILGYQTEAFPDFYTRDSGEKVDYKLDTPEEIAKIIKTKDALGLPAGIMIANPIPKENEVDPKYIKEQIKSAIALSDELGIKGKDVTPFLLAKLSEITEGRSVEANKALVYNNSKVASQIALALAKL